MLRIKLSAGKSGKGDKAEDAKANDPKAGADIGKIVNVMSNDTNRVRPPFQMSTCILKPKCLIAVSSSNQLAPTLHRYAEPGWVIIY